MAQNPATFNPQWQMPSAFASAALGEERSPMAPIDKKYGGDRYDEWLEARRKKGEEYGLSLEEAVAFTADREMTDTNTEYAQRFFVEQLNPGMVASELNELIPGAAEPREHYEERVGPEKAQLADAAWRVVEERAKSAMDKFDEDSLHAWAQDAIREDPFRSGEKPPAREAPLEEPGAASKGESAFEGGPARIIMESGRIFDAEDVREDGEFYTLDFGDGNEMSVPKTKVESIKFGEQKRMEALETAPRPRNR